MEATVEHHVHIGPKEGAVVDAVLTAAATDSMCAACSTGMISLR